MPDQPRLGPRLRAIAARVIPGRTMADLCCDHAQLAAALVVEEHVPRAIAGDINPTPLAAAQAALAAAGVTEVELRRGDGLSVLGPEDQVATLVLAGIGAPLTETLLERGHKQLAGIERVIVQPNHSFPKLGSLRAKLGMLGLNIVDECLARERGRFYVTIVSEPSRDPALELDPRARELGPILARGADPLWPAWLDHERARVERALTGLARARQTPAEVALATRYREFTALLDAASRSSLSCA